MYRSLFVWILFFLMMGSAWADDREIIEEAQTAYRAGDYASAFETLSHLPNLLGVVPLFDRPQQSQRAEIFFDLGRMHMASGDTARARLALVEAFYLHPEVNRGIMDILPDQALADTRALLLGMRLKMRQQTLEKTTFWGATSRSLILAGLGTSVPRAQKTGICLYGGFGSARGDLACDRYILSQRVSYLSRHTSWRFATGSPRCGV